jgi:hypothetical protein
MQRHPGGWDTRITCTDCKARYELFIGTGKDRRILLKDKTTGNVLEELPRIAPSDRLPMGPATS